MASIAILFSTAAAVLVSLCLAAFADPSLGQLAFAYLLVGKATFWATILRLSGLPDDPAPLQN